LGRQLLHVVTPKLVYVLFQVRDQEILRNLLQLVPSGVELLAELLLLGGNFGRRKSARAFHGTKTPR
jgi:hypothetical protein